MFLEATFRPLFICLHNPIWYGEKDGEALAFVAASDVEYSHLLAVLLSVVKHVVTEKGHSIQFIYEGVQVPDDAFAKIQT